MFSDTLRSLWTAGNDCLQKLIGCCLFLATTLTAAGALLGSIDIERGGMFPARDQAGRPMVHASRRRHRHSSEPAPDNDVAASYSRFSSDLQRHESNRDQQRTCRDAAERNNHRISPELEFSDEAVSGTKRNRVGLNAMVAAAEAGEFSVLYFHSLSRLARESVITMPMLKRLVHVYNVRVISVTEGIDSCRDNWELIASILSVMHERYIKELAENVLRGQVGAVLENYCLGDYRFGYNSEPIPGSEGTRRDRNAKPRMRYIIDPATEPWVLRIFYWYVSERRSISWIVRQLNLLGAPKDHRSSTTEWRHQYVVGVLSSEKYVGIWPWGEMKNTRDPETGKIRQEPRSVEECEKWTRTFEHLRIIDDETFQKAQELLEENYQQHAADRGKDGKLRWSNRGSSSNPPRHLLSQLVECAECGRKFVVGGSGSRYMFCPGYKMGLCTCKTQLRRDRAERMILDEIGMNILTNPDWVDTVYASLRQSWQTRQRQAPSELSAARRELADVEQYIDRLVDGVERGIDDPSIKERLEQRRERRRELAKRVGALEKVNGEIGPAPTREWLRQQLEALGERLVGDTPAVIYTLRDLLGGTIKVTEIRLKGRQRHYHRGTFSICTANVANAVAETTLTSPDSQDDDAKQITIDFVEPDSLDPKVMEAKKLYDDGILNAEIAKTLKCSKSQVTKLLKHAHKLLGTEMPDGRTRRSSLTKKHLQPPMYEQVSEQAMELFQGGMLIDEIAEELGCDRTTAKKGIDLAHERRGFEVPDCRTRRKSLDQKVRRPHRVSKDEPAVGETNAG